MHTLSLPLAVHRNLAHLAITKWSWSQFQYDVPCSGLCFQGWFFRILSANAEYMLTIAACFPFHMHFQMAPIMKATENWDQIWQWAWWIQVLWPIVSSSAHRITLYSALTALKTDIYKGQDTGKGKSWELDNFTARLKVYNLFRTFMKFG